MPGTGLSFLPALSPYNRKKGISDRKSGSTLILRPVLCPSTIWSPLQEDQSGDNSPFH